MKTSNSSDSLDDLLKRKLGDYEQEPPKRAWKNIRAQLNATNRASWTTYAEGFALLCLIASALYWMFNLTPSQELRTIDAGTNAGSKETTLTVPNSAAYKKATVTRPASKPVSSNVKESEAMGRQETPQHVVTKKENLIPVNSDNRIKEKSVQKSAGVADVNNKTEFSSPQSRQAGADKTNNDSRVVSSSELQAKPSPGSTPGNEAILTEDSSVPPLERMEMIPVSLVPGENIDPVMWKADPMAEGVPDRTNEEPRTGTEYHVGLTYTFNNTWILNQNTYGDFYGSELDYKVDFGSAYGFLAGFDFCKNYGMQIECNLYSLQGQKYDDVIRKSQIRREVELKYSSFPVLFKYRKRVIERESCRLSINYLGGMQYDRLNSASITVNDMVTDAKHKFRTHDIAVLAGGEVNYYFMQSFYLTVGVRGSLSSDINAKDYPVIISRKGIFGDYKRSHNALLGFNASLNYYFGR